MQGGNTCTQATSVEQKNCAAIKSDGHGTAKNDKVPDGTTTNDESDGHGTATNEEELGWNNEERESKWNSQERQTKRGNLATGLPPWNEAQTVVCTRNKTAACMEEQLLRRFARVLQAKPRMESLFESEGVCPEHSWYFAVESQYHNQEIATAMSSMKNSMKMRIISSVKAIGTKAGGRAIMEDATNDAIGNAHCSTMVMIFNRWRVWCYETMQVKFR